ncbi:AraC family transcriptional regulator [Burkholderia oklahomensis]|uniref:AraC family transcriptional regulator n=1 Tax=Burkholderia oklahomensis TaxID=342113 RepID=UPI00016A8303|nr:AraC family transcriptional regulator [Burkholderia oklahomensis]AJX31916.1 helix-turn-helix domain protein [Burkholderia oklahomensis C6786]AOI44688.1 hypothetical protein WI23_02055 [Burkholderia oklahomensis C6786]KUY63377.1 hypothetical protein WI23_07430 [Burkholderia oklahomensis C6786]MBI0359305.1 AraC family transcriptional regulator [Burkholderia oklahomensis]SUW58254.1 transcriptional regulator HilD [Burkholderia oklahomensis]
MKPVANVFSHTAAQRPASLHTIVIALNVMKEMGVSAEVILKGTGISPKEVEQANAMVTHAQEMVLFANALEATGNSAIGLHIGNSIPVTAYGLRGHAMLVSPTLGDAMRLAYEHPLLAISYFQITLGVNADLARVTVGGYTYRADLLILNTDMCLAAVRREIVDLIGRVPAFRRLGLAFPPPIHAHVYSEIFNCEIIFDAKENFLEFDADLLATRLPLAHSLEFEISKRACEKREFELSHWIPADLVGRLLGIMYDNPMCQDVMKFTERLGMSPRSLQRKLKEMGTSFSALHDLVRRDIASRYISENKSIKEIAARLGYKNTSAFSRAMKRWSKLTTD